jgi:hypothetical protein
MEIEGMGEVTPGCSTISWFGMDTVSSMRLSDQCQDR